MKRDTEKDLVPPEYALPDEAQTHRSSAYATDPSIRMPTANRELLSGVIVAQERRKQRERLGREIAERAAIAAHVPTHAPIPLTSIVPVERPAQREREVEDESPGDATERPPTPTARFRQRVTISWVLLLLVPMALIVLVVVWSAAKRLWGADAVTSGSSPAAPVSTPALTSSALPPRGIESLIPPPEPMPSVSASSTTAATSSAAPSSARVSPAPRASTVRTAAPAASLAPAASSGSWIKVNE